jgi:CheY-like chemotaxis protein
MVLHLQTEGHLQRRGAEGVACYDPDPRAARGARVPPLKAMKVLVVEDEFLIAMDLEATLRKLGAAEVRIELDVGKALVTLRDRLPDCAVLDVGIGPQTTEEIADVLLEKRVPLIFATGNGDSLPVPKRLRFVPLVRKPVNAADLEEAFARAFTLARS